MRFLESINPDLIVTICAPSVVCLLKTLKNKISCVKKPILLTSERDLKTKRKDRRSLLKFAAFYHRTLLIIFNFRKCCVYFLLLFFLCRLTRLPQASLLWGWSEAIDWESGGQTHISGSFSSLLQPRLELYWLVQELCTCPWNSFYRTLACVIKHSQM